MLENRKISYKIVVIIATSGARNNLLVERALHSVYQQTFNHNVDVIIVDDNQPSKVDEIEELIDSKRKTLKLDKLFPTKVIKNVRTPNHSGTGAWNSGAYICVDWKKLDNIENTYLAFLDDDDSWERDYLLECNKKIIEHTNVINKVGVVASGINFIEANSTKMIFPSKDLLTQESIFIQNPNIQGSNLFINLSVFLSIGGFDESLKSTTDRDLMMRYVEFSHCNPNMQTIFIDKPLVNYYNIDNIKRVTTDFNNKHMGLDTFYYKYKGRFAEKYYQASLKRAREKFQYILNNNLYESCIGGNAKISNIQPINLLILGFICLDSRNLISLLDSLSRLKPLNSQYLKDFRICIVSTIENKEYFPKITGKYPYKFKIKYLKRQYPIARNRTILQKFIYKVGNACILDFVSWIIDDDSLFYALYNNKKYFIDYFYYIALYNYKKIDVLIGGHCGEPPLPFFSTLRTQLLDLYYHTRVLYGDILQVSTDIGYKEEFYYDLSSKNFNYLEYPFKYQGNIQSFIDKLNNANLATRYIEISSCKIGKVVSDSIYRGGNTIIYNKNLLKIPNFTPYKQYNRRSDFNWAIVGKYIFHYNIKEIILPLTHKRQYRNININCELQKLEADLIGMIFYRIFLSLCKESNIKILSYSEICELFNNEINKLKNKVTINQYRILALKKQIKQYLKNRYEYDKFIKLEENIDKFIKHLLYFVNKDIRFSKQAYNNSLNFINNMRAIQTMQEKFEKS
ncbi:glycosyltransferase family A protein [Helicobacter didelphidarum]|uniref:glycosyltransferase family A protein n=1 Tax=Helicobacter didelphidarum TaxID=2040648 RepID=UPI0015F13842|nr:glycosyltransferase family A protein [Helicobacter didelphidarum]